MSTNVPVSQMVQPRNPRRRKRFLPREMRDTMCFWRTTLRSTEEEDSERSPSGVSESAESCDPSELRLSKLLLEVFAEHGLLICEKKKPREITEEKRGGGESG